MIRLAIFASGKGSNAVNIIRFFRNHPQVEVAMVLSNNADAEVVSATEAEGVEAVVFHRGQFYESGQVADFLKEEQIDFIVLAGFLWQVPQNILQLFHHRILNIHPALLPKFGGKGMYGRRVHESVIDAGERESGISVHLVNENYDEGKIIFQQTIPVTADETALSLAEKIHSLEHEYFPKVIEKYVTEFRA